MALNRQTQEKYEEKVMLSFDHPQVTATTTWKVWKCPTGRTFVLDRASYINPTGLAGDGTNAFNGDVKNGSTVMATLFNTDTGDAGGAALAANTFVEGTLSATVANKWLQAADIVSLVVTLEGTQTLPAGRIVLEGRLL
jgi:hypothetical protein